MDESTLVAKMLSALGVTAKKTFYSDQGQLLHLNFSGVSLSFLPEELKQFSSLQALNLSRNRLTELPAELGQLTSLRYLVLSNNALAKLPVELGQLTNLRQLVLNANQLTQLPVELGQLTNLQILYLHQNRLTRLPVELGQLTDLEVLSLSRNQLTQLPVELSQLTKLRELTLHQNRLTQLPVELGQLTRLQEFTLSGNPSLCMPPPEIVSQGAQEVLAFLREVRSSSVRRYETKLLLVGEGGTGKSSLVRALAGKSFAVHLTTTHGIEVDRLVMAHPFLPTPSLLLHTWDFGGQDIYHATHQFFLTRRSLYVLVWNARAGSVQGKLDDWLDIIRMLAPEAPVLLVATHIDERSPDLNVQQYRATYGQIAEVCSVSSKTGEGIAQFQRTLAEHAAELPLMGQPWPTSWVRVEQALLARPEHHLSEDAYLDLCLDEGVPTAVAQGTLGGYLHDLGKILYFRDDPVLHRIVILKANWITKAISLVLEDPATKAAHGVLTHANLARIWATDEEGHPYARSLHPVFLRLMERFDLSYQIEPVLPGHAPTHSLIPQLLPYDEPEASKQFWPPDPTAASWMHVEMVYRFDVVPKGVMSWFIVRTHRYTLNLHWRDGVILSYEGHIARVELFPMRREMRLVVWGIQPYTFFVILKETLDLLLTRFEGLQVRREVPCICQKQTRSLSACREVYRYEEDLVKRLSDHKQVIECRASYQAVSVLELLYGIHISTAPQVFQSVEAGYQEILRRLNTLQQQSDLQVQKGDLLLQKIAQLTEWNVRAFTRQWNIQMRQMEAECPNTFFLIPDHRIPFNFKEWIGHKYRLFLVCQHPPGPHIADEAHGYDLEVPRTWWKAVAPWLKYLVLFLKFGIPLGDALGAVVDATDFKAVENQLKLLEQMTEDLPDGIEEHSPVDLIEGDLHLGRQHVTGAALRVLHSFLDEVDTAHYWNGLQKVLTPDGNILWLCDKHAVPYRVWPLQVGYPVEDRPVEQDPA